MAIVERYFSTVGSGTQDGTSWANRAPLIVSNAFNSIITGFNFSGSDTLRAWVGPGNYSYNSSVGVASFANAPSATNKLYLYSCDSNGAPWVNPDPTWTADRPATLWEASLPVLDFPTNNFAILLVNCEIKGIKFTSAVRNGPLVNAGVMEWVIGVNSMSGGSVSAINIAANTKALNCVGRCTGTNYVAVFVMVGHGVNLRAEGTASATTGVRAGFQAATTSGAGWLLVGACAIDNPGQGITFVTSQTSTQPTVFNFVIDNCGTGVLNYSTASPANIPMLANGVITNCSGYGIDGGNGNLILHNIRLRNNASGNTTNMGNSPVDNQIDTSAGTDAAEYVDAAGDDFRIKAGSLLANRQLGISQQASVPASSFVTAWMN